MSCRVEPQHRVMAKHIEDLSQFLQSFGVAPLALLFLPVLITAMARNATLALATSLLSFASLSGAVEGDIFFHRSLSIDENSQFEGSSQRVENPMDPLSSVDAKGSQKKDKQSPAPAPLRSIDAAVDDELGKVKRRRSEGSHGAREQRPLGLPVTGLAPRGQ